jgi:FtsZ-binding cell division protein ZapB
VQSLEGRLSGFDEIKEAHDDLKHKYGVLQSSYELAISEAKANKDRNATAMEGFSDHIDVTVRQCRETIQVLQQEKVALQEQNDKLQQDMEGKERDGDTVEGMKELFASERKKHQDAMEEVKATFAAQRPVEQEVEQLQSKLENRDLAVNNQRLLITQQQANIGFLEQDLWKMKEELRLYKLKDGVLWANNDEEDADRPPRPLTPTGASAGEIAAHREQVSDAFAELEGHLELVVGPEEHGFKVLLMDLAKDYHEREEQILTENRELRKKYVDTLADLEDLEGTLHVLEKRVTNVADRLPADFSREKESLRNISAPDTPQHEWREKAQFLLDHKEQDNKRRLQIAELKMKLTNQAALHQSELKKLRQEYRSAAAEKSHSARSQGPINAADDKNAGPTVVDIDIEWRGKYDELEAELTQLKKLQAAERNAVTHAREAAERERGWKVTEVAFKQRVGDLLRQIQSLQASQQGLLRANIARSQQGGAAEVNHLGLDPKALYNKMKEFQINTQKGMSKQIARFQSDAREAREELRAFQEYMKVALLSYQQEILRLRKEVDLFKALHSNPLATANQGGGRATNRTTRATNRTRKSGAR